MRVIQSVLILLAVFGSAWGWTGRFLPPRSRRLLLRVVTTFGLGLGFLTLVMFWGMTLFPGRVGLGVLLAVFALVTFPWVWFLRRLPACPKVDVCVVAEPSLPGAGLLLVITGIISSALVFNTVYWPFGEEDALCIYAPLAKTIFRTAAIPAAGGLYEAYPFLLPLAYAFSHLAYGGINEYLAKTVPALTAVGAILLVWILGRQMRSRLAGAIGVLLLVLTPVFTRWASSGCADVPAAFYVLLGATLAWLWLREGGAKLGLTAGIAVGLAMWTKNSTLVFGISLLLVVAMAGPFGGGPVVGGRLLVKNRRRAIGLIAAAILTALPFYVRNLILYGYALPPTRWIQAVPHDLRSLLVMLDPVEQFGPTGWVFTASCVHAFFSVMRYGIARQLDRVFILAFVVPFYAAWWWWAGYDPRFLATVLPLLAVQSGVAVADLLNHVGLRAGETWKMRLAAGVLGLAILWTPFALRRTVQHKGALLTNPFPDDLERHRLALGGAYNLALAVNLLPGGSRIVGLPHIARYHADTSRVYLSATGRCELPPERLSRDWDFAVYRLKPEDLPAWLCVKQIQLLTPDGFCLYSIQSTRPAVDFPVREPARR